MTRPWAKLSAEELAEQSRPRSDRELAREVWGEEFARARDAGFSPERAAEIAGAEVRLAMRRIDGIAHSSVPVRPPHRVPVGGQIVYDPARDRYVRIGDADDSTPLAAPYDPTRELEHARFDRAEKAFAQAVEDETGLCVEEHDWRERMAERAELLRQSHVIANKLECGGTQAYRTDEYQMHIVSIFSGHVEQIPGFRRICFLPAVAAMVRAQKLAALEYFLERHPFCRFWTFTGGKRVPLSGLRERVENLHARLNELNKELRRRYGAELVFRATELGSVETPASAGRARARREARAAHRKAVEAAKAAGQPLPVWTRAKETQFADEAGRLDRDEATGELLFHPHAHCVLRLPCRLEKETWAEMLRFVWEFWGDHWDDGAIIKDAREACKYVTKPGEMANLEPAELCALEKALHGLRLVTPMGVLKKEIRARKDAGETLRRFRTPEGMVWRVVEDHNRQLSTTDEEKDFNREKRRQDRLDYLDAKLRVVSPAGELVCVGRPHAGAPKRRSSAPLCRVVARCVPAAVASPLKEPRVVVMATRGAFSMETVRNHPLTVKLWNQGIQAWQAGRAIRVHTGTSTGEQRTLTLLADTDERFAPATEPVWEASRPAVPAFLD